jgi:hypothetical protein
MDALYAGLTAWLVELTVAGLILYTLRREEQKVYRRRKRKNGENCKVSD